MKATTSFVNVRITALELDFSLRFQLQLGSAASVAYPDQAVLRTQKARKLESRDEAACKPIVSLHLCRNITVGCSNIMGSVQGNRYK